MPKEGKSGRGKREIRIPFEAAVALGVVLAVLIAALLYTSVKVPKEHVYTLSEGEVATRLTKWLRGALLTRGIQTEPQIIGVSKESGLFVVRVRLSLNGRAVEQNYYVSPDGKYFFPLAVSLENQPGGGVPKSKKPTVELFVMSYCPYGIQMEKAIIPVLRLLGDKVDFRLRFVNYAMHGEGEVWENARQYCIQKLYGTKKLLDYLECFDYNGPNSFSTCMSRANIDQADIDSCIAEVNKEYNLGYLVANRSLWVGGRFPPFPIDDKLNMRYSVRGSPTLVINGQTVNVQRSPEALKRVLCLAFTTPPEECNQTLSSEPTSPGFGGGKGSNTSGSCE